MDPNYFSGQILLDDPIFISGQNLLDGTACAAVASADDTEVVPPVALKAKARARPPRSRSTSVVRPRFGPKGSRLTQPSRVVGARGTSPDHAPAVPAGSGRALPTPLSRATKIRPGYPRPEGRRRIQAPSEPSGPPKSSFNSLPNGRGRGFTPRRGAPDALSLPPGTFATVLAIVFEMTADRADGRG